MATERNTDWEGSWETVFGELRLHQPESAVVYGDYGDKGVIEGSYSNNGVLSGTFTNGNRMGRFQFSIDGDRFSGQWNWEGQDAAKTKWTGKKKSRLRPKLNQYHFIWQGTWKTNHGTLRLRQRGDYVFGDYDTKGTIRGTYNPINKTLSGQFFNNNKAGQFEYALNGNTFKGKWRWKGQAQNPAAIWNGNKTDASKPIFKKTKYQWNFSHYESCAEIIVKRTMSVKEFGKYSKRYSPKGYRLISLNGYDSKGRTRLAAVWEKKFGKPQIPVYELTSSAFQAAFNTHTGNGYGLISVDGYTVNGQTYYAGVFEKKRGGNWLAHHIMSESDFLKLNADYKKKGYRITHLTAYLFNRQPHYGAIWTKKSGGEWVVKHKLTPSQYQSEFNKYTGKRYRLTIVEGYYIGNAQYYAAVWEKKSGSSWASGHDLTAFRYLAATNSNLHEGRKISKLSAYSNGRSVRYAAIWTEKGNKESRRLRKLLSKTFKHSHFGNEVNRKFIVKEVGGPVIAETGACIPFQPLSTLKLLPYWNTILEIDQGKETMNTIISWIEDTNGDVNRNCIPAFDPNSRRGSAPIRDALPTMMWESHNRTLDAFLERYQPEKLTSRAKKLGLTKTKMYYGCPHSIKPWKNNKSTLYDLAKLFEGIHFMEFIDNTTSRKLFLDNMILVKKNTTSYTSPITDNSISISLHGAYRNIVEREAGSEKKGIVDEFLSHVEIRGKGGLGGPSDDELGTSDFLYVILPFKEKGQIVFKYFTIGFTVNNIKAPPGCPMHKCKAEVWNPEWKKIDEFKAEMLSIPIQKALATW